MSNTYNHEERLYYAELMARHPRTPVDVLSKIYDIVDPASPLNKDPTTEDERLIHYTLSHPNADHTIFDRIMSHPHLVARHINSLMENENASEDMIDRIHAMHPNDARIHSHLMKQANLSLPTFHKILDTHLASTDDYIDQGFVRRLYNNDHMKPSVFDKIFNHNISQLNDPNVPITPQRSAGLINGGQDQIKGKRALHSLNDLVSYRSSFIQPEQIQTLESLPEDIKQQRLYNSIHANIIQNFVREDNIKKLYSQDSLLNLMAADHGQAAEKITKRKLLTLDSIKKGVENKQINNDRLYKIIANNGNAFFDNESVKHIIKHSDYEEGSDNYHGQPMEHVHEFLHRKNADGTHDFDPYRQIISKVINHYDLGSYTPTMKRLKAARNAVNLTDGTHGAVNYINMLVDKHRDIVQDDETHKKFAKDVLKPIHQYYRDKWGIADQDLDQVGLEDPTVE
jgi:hypothetical protein